MLSPNPQLVSMFRKSMRAALQRELETAATAVSPLRAEMQSRLTATMTTLRERGIHDRVWLFGSFAWGQPDEYSDIDILVDGPGIDDIAWQFGQTSDRLVHAIPFASAPKSLRERVLGHGKLL